MDGLTATMRLRENPALRSVPIVALTANVMRNVLDQVVASGCDGYIVKPIQVDTFSDQILGFLKDGQR
jgi:two-component system cell cycle response regulator DivK